MSKHTKGPWTFSAADKMNPDRAYGIIAHDDAEGPDGDATQCVAEVCISGDDEIARADAALIAAAPDLLEALRRMVKHDATKIDICQWASDIDFAVAVLNRATR